MDANGLCEIETDDILWDCDATKGDSSEVSILWQEESGDIVATVYECRGIRYYRATEWTQDSDGGDPVWVQAGGYETTERFCYMRERYRGLFGPFESEVFGRVNGRVVRKTVVQTGPNLYAYEDEQGNRTDDAEFTL